MPRKHRPGGKGHRPRQLCGAAFDGWTRCGEGRRKPPGTNRAQAPIAWPSLDPCPEVRSLGQKSPPWSAERRDAPIVRCVPRLASAELLNAPSRRSAPPGLSGEVNKEDRHTRRLSKTRAADAWLV